MDPTTYGIAQAAVSPTMLTQTIGSDAPVSAGVVTAPVATSGVADEPPRGPLVTARMPQGLNSVFVTYGDKQWFVSGPARELDTTRFRRVGDLHGFAVYAPKGTKTPFTFR